MSEGGKVIFSGDNIKYTNSTIESIYQYGTTHVIEGKSSHGSKTHIVTPIYHHLKISTKIMTPKLGVMLVGWGGNNGSTFSAVILANKHKLTWETKDGGFESNYFGSIVKSSTMCLGTVKDVDGNEKKICSPLFDIVPFVEPNDIEVDGWDINSSDIKTSIKRSKVLDIDLQRKLAPYVKGMSPRPSVFNPDFVSPSQKERADNTITGTMEEQLQKLRADIRDFKEKKKLDKIIIMWVASTEKYLDATHSSALTSNALLESIRNNDRINVSPSVLFAVASILEGCTYINGSPQNTLLPSVIQLAEKHKVFVAGDDLKTGQTKVKSSLAEFLIGSGLKPVSIVSYNHLGNNDGKNLDSYDQFRSKEISKSGVINELVESNRVLYKSGDKPDHCIVIKYIPFVEDSKRAIDEYISRICMNGTNTLMIYNTCEDSLLAVPVMLDLVLLSELFSRISIKCESHSDISYHSFQTVLSSLGFLLKAPVTQKGEPLINGLASQKACIDNILRACVGIPPQTHMYLEHKFGFSC